MKKFTIITALFLCSILSAQHITNTLGAGGQFVVKDATNTYFTLQQSTGFLGVGYNVTTPRAQLEVGGYDGIIATGTFNSGTALNPGAGTRMHWYPRKAAFRVGVAEGAYWDDANIGNYSIAMGDQPRATGSYAVAIGTYCRANGDYALAMGSYSQASGQHSIAIGTQAIASGIYSIAIGTGCNTNGYDGSVVIGDNQYFQTAYANSKNQMTMRFTGNRAYRLWTGYPDSQSGVYMSGGANGWSSYSSRYAKENFRELDGEEVLQKIHDMPVTEWNYNGVDTVKYIGPVAQDFYAAFHLGGTDSLGINTICIDGVNMAGVQALEKRTREMRSEIAVVKEETEQIKTMRSQIELLKTENDRLQTRLNNLSDVETRLEELQQLKKELLEQLEILKQKNETMKETAVLDNH